MRTRTGHCFEDAGKRITGYGDNFTFPWVLVHGLPLGTGGNAADLRYPHAWLERPIDKYNWIVWDPSTNIEVPRALYYHHGKIEDTVRYTVREAAGMMIETGHYGHWDEMFTEAEEEIERLTSTFFTLG